MKKNIFFPGLLFILLAGILTIACTKDDNENNKNNGAQNTIHIKNSIFSNTTLQITTGAVVKWVNDDDTAHTVTATDGSFNSGDIAPGATFNHTFSATGMYPYHCMHHPEMTGNIVVVSGMPDGGY